MDSYFNYSTDQEVPLDLSLKSNPSFQNRNKNEFPIFCMDSSNIDNNKTSITSTTQDAECFSLKIDRFIMERIQDTANTTSEIYSSTSLDNSDVGEIQSTKKDPGVEKTECNQTFEWSVTQILETPQVPETTSSEFQYKKSKNLICKSVLKSYKDEIELASAIDICKKNDVRISGPKNATLRGGPVIGKSMKPPCKCIHQCYEKIDYCERLNVFESFWNLRDKREQREFILNYTEKTKKNRSRIVTSIRQFTYKYKLPIIPKSKTIKVCKKMFLNTLVLNDNFIRTTWTKFSDSDVTELKSECRRSLKKVNQETMVKSVRDHISLLPPIEIEYFGPHPSFLNFAEMLNISLIFESYNKWFDPEKYICRVSQIEHKDILINNVNIDFQILKEVKCTLPENYISSNDEQKNRIESSRILDSSAYFTSQNDIYIKKELSFDDSLSHISKQYIDVKGLHLKEAYNDNVSLKLSSRFLIRVTLNLSKKPKEGQRITNDNLSSYAQYLRSISKPKHEQEVLIKSNVIGGKSTDTPYICRRNSAWENFKEGKIVNQNKKSVCAHVNSFVPIETYFLGKKPNKVYLDGSLSIPLMFRFYKEWFDYNKYGRRVETERKYRDIVSKNFNLEFHVVKRDQCDQCQVFRDLKKPSDEQTAIHMIHMQSIVTVHNKKNNDKLEAIDSNGKIMVAIYDFEKVLTCPYTQGALLHNKRKLLCFNFTILDLSIKRPFCYMWDERVAKNGGDEVSSCLLKFLCSNIQNGVEEFRFWTDNDESRNRVIFSMYRYVVSVYKVNIYHNFHIKDHVQSEVASVDSVIEKVSSAKSIFTPEEWKHLIQCSRTNTQEPFTVIDVQQDDFYNFGSYVEDLAWEKDSKGIIINWKEVREVLFSSDNPTKIKFRYECNQEFESIDFISNFNHYEFSRLYSGTLPLSSFKYRDLMHLCNNGAIPKNYVEFYKSLPHDEEN